MRTAAKVAARVVRGIRGRTVPPSRAPVFVLGNQKAGTSAIAGLLAEMTGSTVAIDLRGEIRQPLLPLVRAGAVDLEEVIRRNRMEFSRDVIKHPNLTLVHEALRERFPSSRFLFVVRDPRDNIRSILDRLGIAGTEGRLSEERFQQISPPWRMILTGEHLGLPGEDHLEVLAERWNLMSDVYLRAPDSMVLVRYEDFDGDKLGTLRRLAGSLGLAEVEDVSGRLDAPFQPAGRNRGVGWSDFFGSNLGRIEARCGSRMMLFGYPI